MSMNGDYMSLAEACGEKTHARAWVPGEDFDPYDEDEMETMALVWENERYNRMQELETENARLRAIIEEMGE